MNRNVKKEYFAVCTVPGWQFWQEEVWIFINHETGATKLVDLKNLSTERERERERERWNPSMKPLTQRPANRITIRDFFYFLFFIVFNIDIHPKFSIANP